MVSSPGYIHVGFHQTTIPLLPVGFGEVCGRQRQGVSRVQLLWLMPCPGAHSTPIFPRAGEDALEQPNTEMMKRLE